MNCSIHGTPLDRAVKGPHCQHGPFELSSFKAFFAHLQAWEIQFCPVCGDRGCSERTLIQCDATTGKILDTSVKCNVALAPVSPKKKPALLSIQNQNNTSRQRVKRKRADSIPYGPVKKTICTVDTMETKTIVSKKSRGRVVVDQNTFCRFCNCEYGIGNTAAHQNGKKHKQKMEKRARWLLRRQQATKDGENTTTGPRQTPTTSPLAITD